MKIAYLIAAHNNYGHLKRLVSALNDTNVAFFIHIDNTLELPGNLNEFENLYFIRGTRVYWGGWSFTEAIIALLKKSVESHFDYYIFLSGVDYPIRPNSFLYDILSDGGEHISMIRGFSEEKKEDRLKYYYLQGFDRRNNRSKKAFLLKGLEKIIRLFFSKKAYPFKQVYMGSTWWALSHDCVTYVLNELDKNSCYIEFYSTCWAPDESIFHTIIGNSPFFERCKNNLTYQDWNSSPAPALINKSHVELLKKEVDFTYPDYGAYTPFFARKFDDKSMDTTDLIEKELRKQNWKAQSCGESNKAK